MKRCQKAQMCAPAGAVGKVLDCPVEAWLIRHATRDELILWRNGSKTMLGGSVQMAAGATP
jgi:hypothetical protein